MEITDFGRKCRRCHQYACGDGSDLCAPCMVADEKKQKNRHPESCKACAEEHFLGVDEKPPSQKFRDPMCPNANPSCLYYEAALTLISRDPAMRTTAMMLSKIRTLMLERSKNGHSA